MRVPPRYLVTGLLALIALAACSHHDDPAGPTPAADPTAKAAGTPDEVVLGNYVVTYAGRTYDGQETTFSWHVAGTGQEPDLRWFFVEVPDCAPTPSGYLPVEGGQLRTLYPYGLDGVKWLLALDAEDPDGRLYSIILPGDVAEGVVTCVADDGETEALGEVYGPCGGFEISGTVFTDTDGDGTRGPAEGGIADVVVEVTSAAGAVDTVHTAPDGSWRVYRPAGDYTVGVDPAAWPDAFNATLERLFTATTALSYGVTVGPDSTGLAFGFTPDTRQIISDLDQDVILADGEPVRWWKKQVHAALRISLGRGPSDPNPGRPVKFYDPETVLGFIAAIEALALPEPYVFTPDDELAEAYEILRRHPRTEYDELYRELLTTEFNHVSGRGLVTSSAELQRVLIGWGESLLAAPAAGAAADKADTGLLDAITIFKGINTGGGGGIDE